MFGLRLKPSEKELIPYYGQPVCLLMKDGSRKIGQLTACQGGKIILNGGDGDVNEAKISRKTAVRRTARKRTRKPLDPPAGEQPPEGGGWGDFSFAPLSFEPPFAPLPRENVPIKSVESVLLL